MTQNSSGHLVVLAVEVGSRNKRFHLRVGQGPSPVRDGSACLVALRVKAFAASLLEMQGPVGADGSTPASHEVEGDFRHLHSQDSGCSVTVSSLRRKKKKSHESQLTWWRSCATARKTTLQQGRLPWRLQWRWTQRPSWLLLVGCTQATEQIWRQFRVDWMQWFRAHIDSNSLEAGARDARDDLSESCGRGSGTLHSVALQTQRQHIRLNEDQLTTDTADLKMMEDVLAEDTAALEDTTQDCQAKAAEFTNFGSSHFCSRASCWCGWTCSQMGSRGQHPGRRVEDCFVRASSTLGQVGEAAQPVSRCSSGQQEGFEEGHEGEGSPRCNRKPVCQKLCQHSRDQTVSLLRRRALQAQAKVQSLQAAISAIGRC